MFGQDWGGLIGLRLVAEHPDRFARVVVGNTGLPTGDQQMSEAFLRWRQFSQTTPSLPIGAIVRSGCVRPMPDEVTAAYDAPFPTDEHKVGARRFPALVPADPTDPAAPAQKRAWQALKKFDRPFLCAFSDSDPVTGGGERAFLSSVPGCAGQDHVTIGNAGHFLQEDAGPELAAVISEFIHKTG